MNNVYGMFGGEKLTEHLMKPTRSQREYCTVSRNMCPPPSPCRIESIQAIGTTNNFEAFMRPSGGSIHRNPPGDSLHPSARALPCYVSSLAPVLAATFLISSNTESELARPQRPMS